MRDIIKKLLQEFEVTLSAVFLSVTVLVVIVNVILRYLFDGGLYWAEEVSTSAFIWSVFIGASAAYRYKMHIGIDLITKLFPERARELVSIIINFLMAVINGYVCYLSVLLIQANKLKRTPVLDIPSVYVNFAITVGFGLMTIHSVRFLIGESRLFFGKSGKAVPRDTAR
jgi:TRAP-type C4-dicarboxylate transport system permease small subunit